MATITKEKRLRAPLLDRLLDDEPQHQRTEGQAPHHLIRQLRESVRRDLERLFNTRNRCLSPPPELPALRASLLNYGLEDISSVNLVDSARRRAFCQQVEEAILLFEPRIRSVKVATTGSPDPMDNSFRFRIEAVLHATPAPETVVFDSVMNPINQTVDVVESER